jgi:hypothetical protein
VKPCENDVFEANLLLAIEKAASMLIAVPAFVSISTFSPKKPTSYTVRHGAGTGRPIKRHGNRSNEECHIKLFLITRYYYVRSSGLAEILVVSPRISRFLSHRRHSTAPII